MNLTTDIISPTREIIFRRAELCLVSGTNDVNLFLAWVEADESPSFQGVYEPYHGTNEKR